MGIGFVLLAYVLILTTLAIPTSIGIVILNLLRRQKGKSQISWHRLVIVSAYPFLGVVYIISALILNGLFCEYVRGVDPGFGDGWEVPIKNGYKFCMVDDTESGYLMLNGCTGATDLTGITKINILGDSIYAEATQPLIFNLKNGEYNFTTKDAKWGSSIEPKLLRPGDFYRKQRGRFGDIVSLGAMASPPLLLGIWRWKKKRRSRTIVRPPYNI